MQDVDFKKCPRLYVTADLAAGQTVGFSAEQAHYLRNVLRCEPGTRIRLFNGRDGEFSGALADVEKKSVTARIEKNILPQTPTTRLIHLIFAPIKKARLDWLIEKAVELGATHLHPVITKNTQRSEINHDRLFAQIIEAAEQCERLDLPALSLPQSFETLLSNWDPSIPIYVGVERADLPPLRAGLPETGALALMVGPEGGWSPEEIERFQDVPFVRPVSFGPRILRAETAVCYALSATQP